MTEAKIEFSQESDEAGSDEISKHILKYGHNFTSVVTLYTGFKYFKKYRSHNRLQELGGSKELVGVIAYVETPTAWVAAGDPICEENLAREMIVDFVKMARKISKICIFLPTSKKNAALARKMGFTVFEIGKNPWISLNTVSPTVKEQYLQKLHVARQLHAKGAIVERFDPLQITTRERLELDSIAAQWLRSKKTIPLAFLNQVKPWSLVRVKRYYRVLFHGQQIGFLAAIPIPVTNSWYLIDLIRSPQSPLGTTELLVIEAIDLLKKEGANEVTLGTSVLVPVTGQERELHKIGYRISNFMFDHFNFFYGFKSLYQYKDKFETTHWEPVYLISSSRFFGIRASYGIIRALFGKPVTTILATAFFKALAQFDLAAVLHRYLSHSIVTRTLPKRRSLFIVGAKSVSVLTFMNILFFLFAIDRTNRLRPIVKEFFGYSWEHFSGTGLEFQNLRTLLLSSFLHFDLTHLVFNLLLLVFLVGFLELIAGSVLVVTCYFFGVMLSNPMTSVAVAAFLHVVRLDPGAQFFQKIDVGCSLGVFSCLGAFCHFMKRSGLLIFLLLFGIVIYAALVSDLMALNHLVAVGIGLLVAMKQYPKAMKLD